MNTDNEIDGKVVVVRDRSGGVYWGVAEMLPERVLYIGGLFSCFRPTAIDFDASRLIEIYEGPEKGETEYDWLKRTSFPFVPKGDLV